MKLQNDELQKERQCDSMFFTKRKTVFDERNKALWEQAKQVLEQAGIPDIKVGAYEKELPMCGCGAKLDARDFGKHGKIDRNYYYIMVPEAVYEQAKALLEQM